MRCVWRVTIMAAVAVVVAMAMEDVEVDVVDTEVEVPLGEVAGRSQESGRTLMTWAEEFMSWLGWDYDEDYYDDYYNDGFEYYPPSASAQLGYGLPSIGYVPPTAGGPESSYSSYAPFQVAPHPQHLQQGFHGSHHPARHDTYDDDEWSFTDVMYNLGMAVIPMGLLYSALPTGLFTFALRRRSFDDNTLNEDDFGPARIPLTYALMDNDKLQALLFPSCQRKLFCEITQIGEMEESTPIQRAMFFVATLTPDFMAQRVGLARLFRQSRSGDCSVFHCPVTSGLSPPPIMHKPSDTNNISEVTAAPEKEAAEVSEE